MSKYCLGHIFSFLFAVLIFCTASNGQANTTALPKDLIESKATREYPKMVKTQGANPNLSRHWNTRCCLQDKMGNLWFGTTGEGVYRYDGKLFTQFTTKDGLSSNVVYAMLEDKAGNIWIGTDAGLCRYDARLPARAGTDGNDNPDSYRDGQGKTITAIPITTSNNVSFHPGISSLSSPIEKSTVWSILQDKKGTIWIGTADGVYCYNGKAFSRFLDNPAIINKDSLHLKMIDCMLEDKNGDIWFGSGMPPGGEGICRYDGKSITNYKPKGEGWIRNMFEGKNGNLWIGTRHFGACNYDGKNFNFFTEKEGIGNPMLEDKAGNIWFGGGENENGFGGDGGIWRYDGKSFTNYTVKDGLGDYSVWCMMEDKAGDIWVGTRNNGLYRFDGKTFTSYSE